MNRRERVVTNLKRRRQRLLDGYVNCIPSKFKRFSNDFIGIEQSCYYTITSFTKGAKSQFTSDVFIFEPLLYCYNHKDKDVSLKVLYFPLEETEDRITERFMSWLIYRYTKGRLRVCPRDLRSTTFAVPQEVFDILEKPEIVSILDYFEEHVIIAEESANPTGIYKYCVRYAEEHGKVYHKKVLSKDELGNPKEIEIFERYEQDNPNEYRLVVIDTINLIDTERGMTTKQSMDKLSEYLAKYLRNRYHYSPVVIQQQAFDQESNDAFKLGRVRPSVAGLGDSKYTSRDSNVVLGLFSPFRFKIPDCEGYDITKLRDHFRLLEVIVNRDGEMGGLCPLFFDGAVSTFSELPRPEEKDNLKQIYSYVEQLKQPKKSISLILKSLKKLIKKNG